MANLSSLTCPAPSPRVLGQLKLFLFQAELEAGQGERKEQSSGRTLAVGGVCKHSRNSVNLLGPAPQDRRL